VVLLAGGGFKTGGYDNLGFLHRIMSKMDIRIKMTGGGPPIPRGKTLKRKNEGNRSPVKPNGQEGKLH